MRKEPVEFQKYACKNQTRYNIYMIQKTACYRWNTELHNDTSFLELISLEISSNASGKLQQGASRYIGSDSFRKIYRLPALKNSKFLKNFFFFYKWWFFIWKW